MAQLDKVIDEAGKLVSRMTHYPAFTLATAKARITIKRYDLIMVDVNSFIAVVMTDNDVVRNKIIRLPSDLNEPQLQLLNTLLNTSFVNLTLSEITPELMRWRKHAAGRGLWPDLSGGLLRHVGPPGAGGAVHSHRRCDQSAGSSRVPQH